MNDIWTKFQPLWAADAESTPTPAPTPDPDPVPAPASTPDPDPASTLASDPAPKSDPAPTPDPVEPLTVESFEAPEGTELSEDNVKPFLEILNNRELSPKEQGQALINLQADMTKEASEQASELWMTTRTEWQDTVKADTALGGVKLDQTLANVAKVVDMFGDSQGADKSEALRQAQDVTGIGDRIEYIQFLSWVAEKLTEGSHVSGAPATMDRTHADIMYPNQGKT